MPSQTFHNLSNAKKTHIIESIKYVFLNKPLNKISVSDIVQQAKIPRGSFYQYFSDIEDAFTYLADASMQAFENEIMSRVEGKNIAFFDYLTGAFEKDYDFFKASQHQKVISKFFSQNQLFTIDYENYRKRKETFYKRFIEALNTEALTHVAYHRLMNLYFYLSHLKIQLIQKVIKGRADFETTKNEYQWIINTFEAGLKENGHYE